MRKTLRQLAADPNYMTPLDVRRELQKATNDFNDYMSRSVGGRTGFEWDEDYKTACRNLLRQFEEIKETDPRVKEKALRDITLGEKFGKHFKMTSELLMRKNYWEAAAERVGVSNMSLQLAAGIMPDWRRRLDDPYYDDPDKTYRPPTTRQIVLGYEPPQRSGRLDVARGGNELYKGLAA